mgnify:CR=1 FL=1
MLGLALALAVIAFVAFEQRMRQMAQQAQDAASEPAPERKTIPAIRVLVAERDLDVGAQISRGDLAWEAWPSETDIPDRLLQVDPTQSNSAQRRQDLTDKVADAVLRTPVTAGQPLPRGAWFDRGEAGFLPGVLTEGMRAVTIDVTLRTAGAGFILPNDRVDVLVSRDVPAGRREADGYRAQTVVETVVHGVRVLALNRKTDANGQVVEEQPKTLTLEVTPAQAQKLHVARQMGAFSVTLRPLGDAPKRRAGNDADARAFTTDRQVFDDFARARAKRAPAPGADDDAPGDTAPDPIVVYRNGEPETASQSGE